MKIGIVGLGYWGKHYVRIVGKSSRVNLTAICDNNIEMLNKYNLHDVKKFIDYKEMISSNTIDSIIIITIASLHKEIVEEALKYKLNIFVEKPYTLNLQDCLDIEKSLTKTSKIMIGHTYLFNYKINYIKNFIKNEMNNIKTINFDWSCFGPIRKDTTPIFDLAVHPLSIVYYLFPDGNIENIQYLKSSSNNTYFVNFLKNNIIFQLNISWSSPGKTRKMIINDDKIKLIFDDVTNSEPIKILYTDEDNSSDNNNLLLHSDGKILIPQIKNSEPLTEQFNYWIDYCENNNDCISDHYFGKKIIDFCEKIQ